MESYLNHKRIIISTDTKELQTQLIKKDIPNVIQSLGLEDKIRFGYIKGKSNYICVEKLEKYIKEYENDKSLEKHRALDDVVDTIKVVNALLMRLKDKENKSMTLENLTFRINTTLNRFGLNKWSWSEIIDRGNYNINNIDVIYENEEIKNKSKKNLKNTLINHRFNYEHLLKNKELWQSKKGFNYEFRPGQFELSKLIRETMNTSGENIACIEAPTGIGKSVSY